MEKEKAFPSIEILRKTKAPVFGVAGTHIMRLLREISRAGLQDLYIPARTELAAGYMAAGYSRSGSRIAFCLVTPGPGFLIGASAMLETTMKGTPVVFLSGQIHGEARGQRAGALHEFEGQPRAASLMIENTFFPERPEEVNRALAGAVRCSLSLPLKPSYVELPLHTLKPYKPVDDSCDLTPIKPAPPSRDSLRQCQELINNSRHPVIFAGHGALFSRSGEKLRSLAEKIQAPLITTITAKGAIPEWDELSGGVYRRSAGGKVMERGDLLIALGTSFSLLSTDNRKGPFPRKIINVNLDAFVPKIPGAEIVPVTCTVEDFIDSAEIQPRERGKQLLETLSNARTQSLKQAQESYPKEMAYIDWLENSIPAESAIYTDPTIIAYWMRYFYRTLEPSLFAYPSGSNSLGYAFPAALGRLTAEEAGDGYVITGDGNFPYFAGELMAASEKNLDITIILFNDSGYGVLREWDRWGTLERIGVNLKNPDFNKICEAFGIEYNRADCPEDLGDILKRTKKMRGTRMIEVQDRLLPPWKVL